MDIFWSHTLKVSCYHIQLVAVSEVLKDEDKRKRYKGIPISVRN